MDISYGDFDFATSGIPVPRVTINYQPQETSAGRQIGTVVDINLKGQVYGTGYFAVIKASGIADAFAHDYRGLRINCDTAQVFPPVGNRQTDIDNSIYVKSINFTNSTDETMYYLVDFDISLSAHIRDYQMYMYGEETDGPIYLRNLSDSWDVSEVKDKATYLVPNNSIYYPSGGPPGNTYYNISRQVRAEGLDRADSTAFGNARKAVKMLLKKAPGVFQDNDVISSAPSANTIKIYDRVTSYQADTINGSLTYTENYVAFTGNPTKSYTHDFNISNTLDQEFNRTTTINGTIQGYDLENNLPDDTDAAADQLGQQIWFEHDYGPSQAYVNASGALADEMKHLYARVVNAIGLPSGEYVKKHDASQSYPDFKLDHTASNSNHSPQTERLYWLHPTPASFSADHDVNNGSISYNCSFDNRPFTIVPGARSEQLSVTDNYAVTGYAVQNIMYRGAHPQHLGTITTPSRTVSYTATLGSSIVGDEVNQGTVLTEESYVIQELSHAMQVFDPKYMDPQQGTENAAISSWITEDQFEINFVEGTLNKTLSWNYTIWR